MTLRWLLFLFTTGVLPAMLKTSTAKQTTTVTEVLSPANATSFFTAVTNSNTATELPDFTTYRPANCPPKCSCSFNCSEVTCSGGRLALPNLPTWTTALTYTNNRVPNDTLYAESLKSFRQVHFLDLSNNGIKFIDKDAFAFFKNLTVLSLNGNPFVRAFYNSFLWPVAWSLQDLSLINVVASREIPKTIWRVFQAGLVTGIKVGGLYLPGRETLNFPNLQRLMLGNNSLRIPNVAVLQNVLKNSPIELLSFSHNNFNQETLLKLWALFDKQSESKSYRNKLAPNSSNADTPAPLVDVIDSIRKILVDVTYNNITGFSDEILHHSQTIWTKHRSRTPIYRLLGNDINLPQVKLLLGGNPMDCSCSIKTAMHFLFESSGKAIITDWKKLACDKPSPLKGLTLARLDELQIHYCHSDWGVKEFKLTPAQLAFIIICGTVLALVSVMVGYLNRSKLIAYWTFLRNCGEVEDYQTSVKWHSAVNKYSIPSDHRGVGHKGYHCEEQVAFDLNGSDGNMRA